MTAIPTTTADDVLALFNTGHARDRHAQWSRDASRSAVREAVLGHVSHFVYRVSPGAVEQLRDRIAADSKERYPDKMSTPPTSKKTRDPDALHPLTVIPKEQRTDPRPRDWSPPLSFNHAFHILLERRKGALFTYPEFVAACKDDHQVLRPLLWDDADRLTRNALELEADPRVRDNFRNSMRWRVGNAYYGFLKEVHILASMRARDVDLRAHPLADTLFRTDFWAPAGWAVSLYVKNPQFKDEGGLLGRKEEMAAFVAGVLDPHVAELEAPLRFGSVVLPDDRFVGALAQKLKTRPHVSISR